MGMFTRFRFVNGTPNPAHAKIKISNGPNEWWVPPTAPLSAPPHGYADYVLPTPIPHIIEVDGFLTPTNPPPPPPWPPPPPVLHGHIQAPPPPPKDDFLEATIQAAHDGNSNLLGCLVGFTDKGQAITTQMH